MPMANRLLPRRSFINGFERDGNFNQLFARWGHACHGLCLAALLGLVTIRRGERLRNYKSAKLRTDCQHDWVAILTAHACDNNP
jgi:hypothetical protein